MISNERRGCKRFTLNHPIMLGTGNGSSEHLAEILDAGVKGMRVRLTNQTGFQVGQEMDIVCFPQRDVSPLTLRCRVAWEDADNLEVGLKYLQ